MRRDRQFTKVDFCSYVCALLGTFCWLFRSVILQNFLFLHTPTVLELKSILKALKVKLKSFQIKLYFSACKVFVNKSFVIDSSLPVAFGNLTILNQFPVCESFPPSRILPLKRSSPSELCPNRFCNSKPNQFFL